MEFGIINQFFCFENSAIMMSGELHFYRVVASYQSNWIFLEKEVKDMENFLLDILSKVVATGICCTFRYIYKKVKIHSNANKSGSK